LIRWEKLKGRFAVAKEIEDQAEEDMGEIPEEFLDPLMATLMSDPVILPISKVVLDRSTIQTHLLSDPHDPFNRSPLTIDQVIEDKETKMKIDAWREEIRIKVKAERAEKMDVSEG